MGGADLMQVTSMSASIGGSGPKKLNAHANSMSKLEKNKA